jgi:hypothetical protein
MGNGLIPRFTSKRLAQPCVERTDTHVFGLPGDLGVRYDF